MTLIVKEIAPYYNAVTKLSDRRVDAWHKQVEAIQEGKPEELEKWLRIEEKLWKQILRIVKKLKEKGLYDR